MKHIFVINPAAGKTNVTEALLPRLHALFVGREEELETYLTTGVPPPMESTCAFTAAAAMAP